MWHRSLLMVSVLSLELSINASGFAALPYPLIDTAQDRAFSTTQEISYPAPGQAFDGQDAQYQGLAPAYRDNHDATVSDLNTGLMWQKTPDFRNPLSFAAAKAGAGSCRVGGYSDWRLPSVKELYSLIDFRGYSTQSATGSRPYIDTQFFDFSYGNAASGGRLIDAQYWSATQYVGLTMKGDETVFGVNFADGRIKGYPRDTGPDGGALKKFVRYVRGNPQYGRNDFIDQYDGTILDRATGLIWTKSDSRQPMNWQQALAYAEGLELAGHDDWRLPNAKELQSIVDYTRAPDAQASAQGSAALDPIFALTETESWFWTSTTHLENRSAQFAVYVCFGQAFGSMHGHKMNVHGAGAQRSDPKAGDPRQWSQGNGPQGDEVRILNYVRCVRGGGVVRKSQGPQLEGNFSETREPSEPGSPRGFVSHLDRNGDGKVSRQEFDGPPDQFDRLDRDGDGGLSEDEAPRQGPQGRN